MKSTAFPAPRPAFWPLALFGATLLRASLFGATLFGATLPGLTLALTTSPVHGLTVSGGETAWRWIGIRHSNQPQCPPIPDVTGWTVSSLFEGTENRQLQRFCLYSRQDAGSLAPLSTLALERLEPDVMAVAPFGSALATTSWPALESHFLSQAGDIELPAGPASRIRLAVVDASPTRVAQGASGPEDVAANSPHGTALLNMARDLLCDASETSCRAQLTSRLALAYECFNAQSPQACRNGEEGGYIGLIGELAQVIHREVEIWQSASEPSSLVLNLSLGWNAVLGGSQPQVDGMPAPAQAVYRVLEDAVCRGALPIVAAGNRDASAAPSAGPFLPALWETRNAPSKADCTQLGVAPAPGLDGPVHYRPLVFSVAGTDASGAPLGTTRREGKARLAAFGDHAVVGQSSAGKPTATLTGSSVSALVVSASAAAVWSYLPQATAFDVMASIYQHATPLGRRADYCLGSGPCPNRWSEVHEVSLCEAVAGACDGTPACAAPLCVPAAALDLSTVDLSALTPVQIVDMTQLTGTVPNPSCASETVYFDPNAQLPQEPCPHHRFDGPLLEPWTEPQPETIPCPNCIDIFGSPGTLYFEVDDQWQEPIENATLRCGSDTYALGLGPLRPGDQVRLDTVPHACLSAYPTFLSFTVGASSAVISPLLSCDGCG